MAKRKRITPAAADRGPMGAVEGLAAQMYEVIVLTDFLGDLDALDLDPEAEPYVRQAVIDRLLVVAKSGQDRAIEALKAPKAVA